MSDCGICGSGNVEAYGDLCPACERNCQLLAFGCSKCGAPVEEREDSDPWRVFCTASKREPARCNRSRPKWGISTGELETSLLFNAVHDVAWLILLTRQIDGLEGIYCEFIVGMAIERIENGLDPLPKRR